ncbi:uncharacterized protein [Lolium perenne]|uniref:uncharacterized protein isoform X1 n=2 Tax=Lolium perenne TaxID=4522 RepID=UPI0021F56A38|nr:uncharacterized protein LOC127327832 isoform X1 [Lolium perenne]
MAAAAGHCARANMCPMTFECGAITASRVKLACPSEPTPLHTKIRELGRLIRYPRDSVLSPRSSFKGVRACRRLSDGRGGRWTARHCSPAFSSAHPSTMERDTVDQAVEGHRPRQPSSLEDDAYRAGLSEKEIERRRKIGAANKGKAPWTKGRKLSIEHRQLIKQRTIEALSDPKVKKKMLGHRQLHRQASKDKISAGLRKVWERRIVSVKSRQMILRIWSNSIAEAAKEGGHMQDEMDWDSYDKIKSEMISVFLWNKEKGRIIKKLKRAVKKIVAKKLQAAEKMEMQTRRAKKAKPPEKLVLQKPDAQPRRVLASTRSKLKERLTKWHGRKKELEIMISSRVRKGGGPRKPAAVRRRPVERRAEVDLVKEPVVPSGRLLKELHSPCKDGLPCADT